MIFFSHFDENSVAYKIFVSELVWNSTEFMQYLLVNRVCLQNIKRICVCHCSRNGTRNLKEGNLVFYLKLV